MGIFDKRSSISRSGFKRYLRKEAPRTRPSTGQRMSHQKRMGMEKVFGKEFGQHITKPEFKKRIRQLERTKRSVKKPSELIDLQRKIKYLKEIGKK